MKTEIQQKAEYNAWKSHCISRGYFFAVERTDIINFFIHELNYANYLEVGVCEGDNIKRIEAQHIDGVDSALYFVIFVPFQ